jgi:glycosyltransferase involved in cell wall biosynthesis
LRDGLFLDGEKKFLNRVHTLISLVTVYNNKKLLDEYLIKSLEEQSVEYELILVDNTTKKFDSAASALNYGAKNVKGDYIVFVHQDVMLDNNDFLKDLEILLDKLDNLGIAGMAGVSEDKPGVLSNIVQGKSSNFVGKNRIVNPVKVQTLDECLLIIPCKVFEKLKYDKKTCNDWHLYGVDYSLSVITLGYNVYALPMGIYHRSPGYSMSKSYDQTLKKVLNKHNQNFTWIYTTLGNYHTGYPLNLQKSAKKFINPILKKLKLWKY